MTSSGLILLVFAVAIVLVVGVPILILILRIHNQRVIIDHGVLSIANPITGALKGFPVDRIGTAVYLPQRNQIRTGALPNNREGSNGIWTWGGIIVLDTSGRVVRHITAAAGTKFPLEQIWEQIPAPVHRRLDGPNKEPYSRSDFKQAFPHSLRFGQLWGPVRWVWFILFLLVIIVPVIVFIVLLVVAVITTVLG